MGVADGPSRWSIEKFGFAQAVALRKRVPAALKRAVERAMDAREASEMTSDHAFGSVRWLVQYEELHHHLRELPDVTDLRPPGAQFRITVCAGHLLLPWHYSTRSDADIARTRPERTLSRFARALLALCGPQPRYQQDTLPLMPLSDQEADARSELREAVERLPVEPKVLLIGYACNSEAGLLRLCWGEAALRGNGDLEWQHVEELPMPGDAAQGRRGVAA
ncbi:hypothetical protein ACFYUR_02345 [Micromonospora haikouensis]|uniref:hypothetical protein n=1 Tax=Micromonospora haikouensis TaxID=686309 RepID=UPI00369BA0A0